MQETLQNHNALLNELPETLGAILTRARLSRKLEAREAANRIGVDTSVVQALEDDDFQQLGAPVFARNFLVRYARLLELPEQEILERFRQMGLDEPPPLKVERPIQRQARMTDIRWLAYPVVVVGVLWLSYLGFERLNVHYSSGTAQSLPETGQSDNLAQVAPETGTFFGTRPDNPGPTASANPVAPALAAIADLTGFDDPDDDSEVETTPLVAVQEPPSEDTQEIAETPAPDEVVSPDSTVAERDRPWGTFPDMTDPLFEQDNLVATDDSLTFPDEETEAPLVAVANLTELSDDTAADVPETTENQLTAPPEGQHQLVLSFNDDCWVEVRDASGERLVRSILNANTVNRFVGEAPFSLTLGNAAAVTSITLNGKTVEESVYAPTRGSVSRFTLEAPSG